MQKDAPHFLVYLLLRPFRMLQAQTGTLELSRRPVKPLRQLEASLTGHGPEASDLFETKLFTPSQPQIPPCHPDILGWTL